MDYPNIDTSIKFLRTLSRDIDAITSKSGRHSLRVSQWSGRIAHQMGLSEAEIDYLRMGALFHDIGKIGIPRHILIKEDPLSEHEWIIIRMHPTIGSAIVQATRSFSEVADLVFLHQEKYNGAGYPVGLMGKDIPLPARILAVVDAYDAMTDDRPYRKAFSHPRAVNELIQLGGYQFDPQVVNVFLELLESEQKYIQ